MRKLIKETKETYITVCDGCEEVPKSYLRRCRICEKVYCAECAKEKLTKSFDDSLDPDYTSTIMLCEDCIKEYDISRIVDMYNKDSEAFQEAYDELEGSINTLNKKITESRIEEKKKPIPS